MKGNCFLFYQTTKTFKEQTMDNLEVSDEPISTLNGKPARVYHTGDMLTDDYIENRANIEMSENEEIVKIWFG